MRRTLYTYQVSGTHSRVSKYQGVVWCKTACKWRAYLKDKGITYECGYFSDDREAAKARDIKILQLSIKKPLQVLKK